MLLVMAIFLLLFWGGGLAFHVAGGLIHLLLVIALIVFVLHFIQGRKGSSREALIREGARLCDLPLCHG